VKASVKKVAATPERGFFGAGLLKAHASFQPAVGAGRARSCGGCVYYSREASYCILLGVPVEDVSSPPCAARPRRTCDTCPHYMPRSKYCALLEVKVLDTSRPPCAYGAPGAAPAAAAPVAPPVRRPELGAKLITAVKAGRVEEARRLLEEGADPNARDERGFTPLHLACARGDQELVELLLERGADPNAVGGAGVTPLHVAAYGGHRGVVEALLRWGADPSLRESSGKTSADVARERGFADLAELIEGWRQPALPAELELVRERMSEADSGVLVVKIKFDRGSAQEVLRHLRGLWSRVAEWRVEKEGG